MHTLESGAKVPHAKRCAPSGGTAVKPQVHGPNYRRLAPLIRAAANSDTNTRCWRCGLTLAEHPLYPNGRRQRWTAGHLTDGQPDWTLTLTDLAPEASRCNEEAGAYYGNDKRIEPRSSCWTA